MAHLNQLLRERLDHTRWPAEPVEHVVAGRVTSGDLAQAVAQGPIPITTLWGAVDARQIDESLVVGGATVVQADITADNGVIHVVDRVVA